MTVGELKRILEAYSDEAEFVIYNKNMDCEISNDFYDMWVTGNKDTKYLDISYYDSDNEERSRESTVVSLNIFR